METSPILTTPKHYESIGGDYWAGEYELTLIAQYLEANQPTTPSHMLRHFVSGAVLLRVGAKGAKLLRVGEKEKELGGRQCHMPVKEGKAKESRDRTACPLIYKIPPITIAPTHQKHAS